MQKVNFNYEFIISDDASTDKTQAIIKKCLEKYPDNSYAIRSYHCQVILFGHRINEGMGKYVAESLVKKLIQADIPVKNAKIAILGFTFKENCPDTRNTKVISVDNELKE